MSSEPTPPRLLYLVHDLSDPSVHRRVRMLRLGGVVDLAVAGFRRSVEPVTSVAGVPAVDLGRTVQGRLPDRLRLLGATVARHTRLRPLAERADVIVARNLEPLALAAVLGRRCAPHTPIVYECLDVHGLMAASGPVSVALRAVERALLHRTEALVVSSPAFVSEYFARVHRRLPRVLVLENQVLEPEVTPEHLGVLRRTDVALGPAPHPPWRIGWLGQIRCERSLLELTALCRALPDTVEVVVRGRPTRELADPLAQADAALANFHHDGPYDREHELFEIYTGLHFSWTLDYLHASSNGRWLLPNRLYEGGLFQCVPLASADVETGRWLDRHGVGVRLPEPVGPSLRTYFEALTPRAYARERDLMSTTPLSDYLLGAEDAQRFVRELTA